MMGISAVFVCEDTVSQKLDFITVSCPELPKPGELVALNDGRIVACSRISHVMAGVTSESSMVCPVVTCRELSQKEQQENSGLIKLLEAGNMSKVLKDMIAATRV